MNLYLVTQNENNSYDTYDSAVVCAESREQAQCMHPRNGKTWDEMKGDYLETYGDIGTATLMFYDSWALPEYVTVTKLGKTLLVAPRRHVICASFNAS